MEAPQDAFDLLHYMIEKRSKRGNRTVVDATNLRPEDRKHLVRIAKKYHVFPVAVVLDIPEQECYKRHESREDRNFGKHYPKMVFFGIELLAVF